VVGGASITAGRAHLDGSLWDLAAETALACHWPQVAICILLPCANSKGFETSLGLAAVQKHSQGPKQVAGVPPLQAICEEWHSIIAEPESQVVFTGPLGMRPRPAIVFLRAFSENSTAASCVKLLPIAATLVQSAACAVTETRTPQLRLPSRT